MLDLQVQVVHLAQQDQVVKKVREVHLEELVQLDHKATKES